MVIPKVLGNICTGQTKCYTNNDIINCNSSTIGDFYGQDAHYAAQGTCIPQKFKIDDSVPEEKTVIDENFGLEWQQIIPTEHYYWEDAVKYCEELNYDGHDDWRLPTINELVSIVDRTNTSPAFNTTFFPNTPSSGLDFWSLSSTVSNTSSWVVSSSVGSVGTSNYSNGYNYVRCVRGEIANDSASFNTLTRNGDEIITDSNTGLIWQKTYETEKTWGEALSYCENLTYAGYSDWKLPNINELRSLINYEETKPASDFPDMPNEGFWSSNHYISYNNNYAWYVNLRLGSDGGLSKGEDYNSQKVLYIYVRCVR